jgi:cytidine deaminase
MTDDHPLNIDNSPRSATTVRQLTPAELGLPSEELKRHNDAMEWDRIVELAGKAAPGNTVGAAAAPVDGNIATGTTIDGVNDSSVHAVAIAVWKAYSEYRAPVRRLAIVTEKGDFEICYQCLKVVAFYGANPTVRIVDREGLVQADDADIASLLDSFEAESESYITSTNDEVDSEKVATPPSSEGVSDVVDDENLKLEYVRFEQPVFHLKYKKLNRTFCGIDTGGNTHRSSDREPDLLDPCKICHGESGIETIEEQKTNIREQLSELVAEVKPPGVKPGEFEPAEIKTLLDALPASFPEFDRSPTSVRHQISRAIKDVSNDPTEPTTFDRSELRALLRAITNGDVIPATTNVFIWTTSGNIKRTQLSEFDQQHRGGRGFPAVNLDGTDETVRSVFLGSPRDYVFAFTNHGQVHRFRASKIPQVALGEMGIKSSNLFNLDVGETVHATLMAPSLESHEFIAMVTRDGYFKRIKTSEFKNIHSGGIRAITLEEDEIRGVTWTDGESDILLESRSGQAIRFDETEVRPVGRGARGVQGIKLDTDDEVVDLAVIPSEGEPDILTVTEQGFSKRTPSAKYRTQSRNGRGLIDILTGDRNGPVVAVDIIREGDHLVILSRDGRAIHLLGDEISTVGRNTKGVTTMQLEEDIVVDASVVTR